MDILNDLFLSNVLHTIASYLLVPTVVVLLLLIIYALYSLGSLMVEIVVERRRYRAKIPELIARLEHAPMEKLSAIVDKSELLTRQKDDLDELISYLYLPEDARTEVAKRLLSNEDLHNERILDRTDIATKVAPMLGLMGTLIPLGPGIIALGTGDVETLSQALLVAFDTTVAGLATAVICFLVSRVRRRWYQDYLVSMEALFNTLLERGAQAHEQGYEFPSQGSVYVYDAAGRRAKRELLDEDGADGAGGADATDGADGADGAGDANGEADASAANETDDAPRKDTPRARKNRMTPHRKDTPVQKEGK